LAGVLSSCGRALDRCTARSGEISLNFRRSTTLFERDQTVTLCFHPASLDASCTTRGLCMSPCIILLLLELYQPSFYYYKLSQCDSLLLVTVHCSQVSLCPCDRSITFNMSLTASTNLSPSTYHIFGDLYLSDPSHLLSSSRLERL
jgi:hypothetical protein